MEHDEHLQRHLEICQQIYLRMKAEGTWPWADSPNSEDVLESDSDDKKP